MGQLAQAVRSRVTPFLGFCGGAQLLGLLEAEPPAPGSPTDDEGIIDEVLRRATGAPIRGFASPAELEKGWPGDPRGVRATVTFEPDDPLFADLAGAGRRLRSFRSAMPTPFVRTPSCPGDPFGGSKFLQRAPSATRA